MNAGFFRRNWDFLKRRFKEMANAELLCEVGQSCHKRAVAGRIGTAETPESQVAIRAAVRPNECNAEPNPLDEASSLRPAYRRALTDRAFADSFGKRELHQIDRPLFGCEQL
jgi:hypothetical protein